MSSLRNSLHRRNHKERSQLSHRARFGILEKHKDYVLRARDFHSKQDRIKRLKQKAAERNKDEFYFGMIRQKTEGGVHVQDRGNEALPIDIVKVLKTQDENYIRTARASGLKKIEKLKSQLTSLADLFEQNASADENREDKLSNEELELLRKAGILQGNSPSSSCRKAKKHFIFVENEEEAQKYTQRSQQSATPAVDESADIDDVDLGWKQPIKSLEAKKKRRKSIPEADMEDQHVVAQERRESASKHRSHLLKELSARLARDIQLRYAERELEMQRLMMGKGARRKVRGAERVDSGAEDGESDDGEDDDGRRKGGSSGKGINDKAYKPRVYKWKVERKR
ncbi:u3 small nucleolar RNA-associated protein 11 [Rickenella mellea]|uniref:U3 small nucleolar RNA-associated protein 11 n=1 Tax=Rickenella mellea TaxID=50990 RepID=A0A4Y7QLJ6_9AGAM|nr:u3 small nucleolar RNA-associated protein 11 [Rickenella mellea]